MVRASTVRHIKALPQEFVMSKRGDPSNSVPTQAISAAVEHDPLASVCTLPVKAEHKSTSHPADCKDASPLRFQACLMCRSAVILGPVFAQPGTHLHSTPTALHRLSVSLAKPSQMALRCRNAFAQMGDVSRGAAPMEKVREPAKLLNDLEHAAEAASK